MANINSLIKKIALDFPVFVNKYPIMIEFFFNFVYPNFKESFNLCLMDHYH